MQNTPDTTTIYVAASLANLLISFLDQRQLALPVMRERLTRLAQGPRMPITTWWALLDEIQQACPDEPALGLQIGSCAHPHHIGVLGYLAMYSDTVGQALLRFSRFQPLLHNLAPSLISQHDDTLVIGWGKGIKSTLLSDDVISAGLSGFARQLTGRDGIHPTAVYYLHPRPADVSLYEAFYGCPVYFDSPVSAMHLPLAVMSLPINTQDPHLTGLLEQQAEAMLQALPVPDSLLGELHRQIVVVLQDGPPEAAMVAARMGLSERSLYRALQERGLRYKQVLNSLRYELAKDYLRDAQLSLPEIALLLGYAEQSVFSRAFRDWAGQSPMRWRKACLHRSTS